MGGRALKNTFTRRYQRAEFDELSKELLEKLNKDFPKAAIPLFYKNKESFGDIDILVQYGVVFIDDANGGRLVSDPRYPMREYIELKFEPKEIFHNGNCYSFDYKEIQVDLILTSEEDFDSNLMYLSYNDLGNYIGRIAQGFGLKYGTEGLWYEHYFKGQNIGTLPVSKDYPKIFNFLGLDYKVWEAGFDNLEDIFKFIAYSPYFNWEMYQLASLNKINRDRNAKRASYMSFLEWIDKNIVNNVRVDSRDYMYPFYPDKTAYFDRFVEVFPEARLVAGVRRLEYEKCKDLYIRSKFSGDDIARKFGLEGKALGEAMAGFKIFLMVVNYVNYDFEKYILETKESEIYKDFETFLSAR